MEHEKTGASTDAPVFRPDGIRWGLCCQFIEAPIRFRQATHRYCAKLNDTERASYLSEIALSNAAALNAAIMKCSELGIGAFRITSRILPLATHPESGYRIEYLPDGERVSAEFVQARETARRLDIRLSFHPDQFVVLNSESTSVVASSVREMDHQALVAQMVGAEALTLHAGGIAGGVKEAIERLERGIEQLGPVARSLLALENDDRLFSPGDLLPFCERTGIPFVYDVHHHRCHPDDMEAAEASERAAATWRGREAWMHISSSREGPNRRMHSDYVDPREVPDAWLGSAMTVDVEAKAKERAVLALKDSISERSG